MIAGLLLRWEFGVIVLYLNSNEVNGLMSHGEGRQNQHHVCDGYEFLGLFCRSFSKYMIFYICSSYVVHFIALFHKSQERNFYLFSSMASEKIKLCRYFLLLNTNYTWRLSGSLQNTILTSHIPVPLLLYSRCSININGYWMNMFKCTYCTL